MKIKKINELKRRDELRKIRLDMLTETSHSLKVYQSKSRIYQTMDWYITHIDNTGTASLLPLAVSPPSDGPVNIDSIIYKELSDISSPWCELICK